jgi:hypothetical protein
MESIMKRPVFKTKSQQYILSLEHRAALASRCMKFGVLIEGYLRKPCFLGYDAVPIIYQQTSPNIPLVWNIRLCSLLLFRYTTVEAFACKTCI